MKVVTIAVLLLGIGLAGGCATSMTQRVQYPSADDLFVTSGDDPGSESPRPYIPKGFFLHVEQEAYVPLPLFGAFLKVGEADPQYVFDNKIIPRVREMGGDALTDATVQYTPPGPILLGLLLGMRSGGITTVSGQAVKRAP